VPTNSVNNSLNNHDFNRKKTTLVIMKLIFHKRAATNQPIFPALYVMQLLVKQKVSNLCTNFLTHHQQGAMARTVGTT